jgi:SAM-dependent methyltransferase
MKKRILNVGCGEDTYGTDFVDLYPQREEVKKCDLDNEKLPYNDEIFDIVYSKCVFEHLKNPGITLKEMARVLKKGGEMILITDNASYWYYALDNKTHTGKYESVDKFGTEDKHYCLFTDWHLHSHFLYAGLEPKKITYEESTGKDVNIRGRIVKIIDKILSKTIKRMAFGRIKIIGIKK